MILEQESVDTGEAREIGKRSRIGIYWNLALKTLHQSYHIVVVVVLVRTLTPEDFGLMALAMAVILFANQWTKCGLTRVIIQKEHLSNEEVNTVFTLNLLLSLVMMAVIGSLASTFGSIFGADELASMIPILTLMFPLTSYYQIRMALLRRDVKFRMHSMIDLVLGMVQSTTVLGLALSGFGVWSLLWGHLIGMVAATVAIVILAPWYPRLCWRFVRLRSMARYAGFDMLRSQLVYLDNYLSYWIVGYWMTPAALGLFDRASAFARMPLDRINIQMNTVFFSAFCRVRGDSVRLDNAFRKSLTAQAIILSPILVGMAAISPHAIPLLLGGKWESIALPLQILCAASLIRIFATTLRTLNIATHVYARQTLAQCICLPAYAGLCVLSLPWGIAGVSVATLISSAFAFVLYASISRKILANAIGLLVDCLAPALAGALMMGMILLVLIRTVLADITFINLFSLIVVGAVFYVAWVMWLPHNGVRSVREDLLADLKNVLRAYRSNIRATSD